MVIVIKSVHCLTALPTTLYIAETDERNALAAVWIRPRGKRTVSVFDPEKHAFDKQERAEFSGASETAIKQWLLHQRALGAK